MFSLLKSKHTPKEESPEPDFLPYGRQVIEADDILAVAEALQSAFLTTGPAVEAFEEALANYVGVNHAVVCANGTAALHLAAAALDLGPGDLVIVPSITFVATANAVRYVGADVVFADVDPDTGLMGPAQLREAIEHATNRSGTLKAVFNVHLAGQCGDVVELQKIAKAHQLHLLDDGCHALGTSYSHDDLENKIGECAHTDMTVFSFHPVKAIAMGEGGAITTNDPALAARLQSLRNHGLTRDPAEFKNPDVSLTGTEVNPWAYELHELGWNYRASDIHCALGLNQLKKLDRFVERRRELANAYDKALAPLAPLLRPLSRTPNVEPGWHLYVALIDFESLGKNRLQVMRELRALGIGSQVHYIPVHLQPYYKKFYGERILPGTQSYYDRCLSLPLAADMTPADVARVSAALTEVVTR